MIEEITESISVKVSEDIDNLIITTICDWYERDTEIRISKRDLKRALGHPELQKERELPKVSSYTT